MKNEVPTILVIFIIIMIFIKSILPIIIITVIIMAVVYIIREVIENKKKKEEEKKKRINNEINSRIIKVVPCIGTYSDSLYEEIENKILRYKSIVSKLKPNSELMFFYDVIIRRLSLKLSIVSVLKKLILALSNELPIEELDIALDNCILEFANYVPIFNEEVINPLEYEEIKSVFRNLPKSVFVSYNRMPTSNNAGFYIYDSYKSDNSTFLSIQSSFEILHITDKCYNLFLYPNFIIVSKNKEDFSIIKWEDINLKYISSKVTLIGYRKLKGARELSHRYTHMCIDGTPDMRYKNNEKYTTYELFIIQDSNDPRIKFYVADKRSVRIVIDAVNKYRQSITNSMDTSSNEDYALNYFVTSIENILSTENIQIIHEKKLLYLLSDVNAFKEDKVYSRIFKKMHEEGLLSLMSEDDLDSQLMILKSNEYAVEYSRSNSDIYEFIKRIKGIIDSHRT